MKRGLVYILQLENACWYVGWTTNPKQRMREHFYRPKNNWVIANKPIDIAHQFYGTTADEVIASVQMANVFGVETVRGGAYNVPEVYYYPERVKKPARLVIGDEFWLDLVYDDRYLASKVSQQNLTQITG